MTSRIYSTCPADRKSEFLTLDGDWLKVGMEVDGEQMNEVRPWSSALNNGMIIFVWTFLSSFLISFIITVDIFWLMPWFLRMDFILSPNFDSKSESRIKTKTSLSTWLFQDTLFYLPYTFWSFFVQNFWISGRVRKPVATSFVAFASQSGWNKPTRTWCQFTLGTRVIK